VKGKQQNVFQVDSRKIGNTQIFQIKILLVVPRCEVETIPQKFYRTTNMHYDAKLGNCFLQKHHPSFNWDRKVITFSNHRHNKLDEQELQLKEKTETDKVL
jgi:hypothetical protein